jgi:hypothetical protein
VKPDPPIALREPVQEICRLLGVPYANTSRITIWPGEVEIVEYRERGGHKYIDPETDAPAQTIHRFRVTT